MQKKQKTLGSRIVYAITLIILFILLYFAYQYYQLNNFNDFVRSETDIYTSDFERDKEIKYSNTRSYKIKSPEYNDAMFYKTISIEKNTPYKVTCMVKTNNVVAESENSGIGAQIAIEGTTERSVAISGTQDWQKIELIFNSKNREEVNIGFRLGGYLGKATGEAWFSDFTIEEGTASSNNNWKFACFVFQTTDVTIDGKEVKLSVTQSDINDIKNTVDRFEKSCNELSEGKMTADVDIFQINTPITKLSYDNEFGYYVAPEDIEAQIKDTISQNDYDHIFIVMRLRR